MSHAPSLPAHRAGARDEITLRAALAADVELFHTDNDEPLIRLPAQKRAEDSDASSTSEAPSAQPAQTGQTPPSAGGGVWPLRSRRVRAWLAALCWKHCGQLPRPRELDAILLVLEDYAWSGPRVLAPLDGDGPGGVEDCGASDDQDRLWAAVERDPVVQAVVELAAIDSPWEGRMSDLLPRLTNLARMRRIIDPSRTAAAGDRDAPWPRIAATLGAHLRRRSELLRQAGVEVTIAHTRRASMVRLANVADPDPHGPRESAPGAGTAADFGQGSPDAGTWDVGNDRPTPSSPANPAPGNSLRREVAARPKRSSRRSSRLKRKDRKKLSPKRVDRVDRIANFLPRQSKSPARRPKNRPPRAPRSREPP